MSSLIDYISEALRRGYSKKELNLILLDKGYSQKEIGSAFKELEPKQEIEVRDSKINYLDKIKLIFSSPNNFFSSIREPGIKDSFLLFLYAGLIAAALGIGLSYLFSAFSFGSLGLLGMTGFGYRMYSSIFSFVLLGAVLASLFIYTGVVHFTARLMGGKGNYTDTFNACAYGLIPFLIITIIPLIGVVSIIYSIVLMTIGLEKYHGIPKAKAAISVILPFAVIIILLIVLIFYLIFALRGIF